MLDIYPREGGKLIHMMMTTPPPPPCQFTYVVNAAGWEREINQALGVFSTLSGVQFTVAAPGTDPRLAFDVKRRLTMPDGTGALAWTWNGDVTFTPAKNFSHTERVRIALHEMMHVFGFGHNDTPGSILNVDKPRPAGARLSADDRAAVTTLGCAA